MYKIVNRLPQSLNIITNKGTEIIEGYKHKNIDILTDQIKNWSKKGFVRICKVKVK